MSWQRNKKWADKFMPTVKAILGQALITSAPLVEDAHRNTDLVVLRSGDVRIACRIRKAAYAQRYAHQFTIRCGNANGSKTELAKILEGWGDFMFYGFANQEETGLLGWAIGDLDVFRSWIRSQLSGRSGFAAEDFADEMRINNDGGSALAAFSWDACGDRFIVACGEGSVVAQLSSYVREVGS